jgi:hypothetical protein
MKAEENTYDLQEESAWAWALQASTLSMFDGVEIGLAFPLGPVGATPQLSRTASFVGPLPSDWLEPVLEVDPESLPVLEEELDPVAAPVGFEAVGSTAGTEGQALS